MKLPEGSVILFILWAALALVLWNLYRYSRALRKRTFIVLLIAGSLSLVGGMTFLHFLQQPRLPAKRIGLLIFPFIEKKFTPATPPQATIDLLHPESTSAPQGSGLAITPQGLAIADMIVEHLRQRPHAPFYLIPPDAVFEVATLDSLIYPEYILRLAKQAKLQIIGVGFYTPRDNSTPNRNESWQADVQLYDFRNQQAVSLQSGKRLTLPIPFESMQAMAAGVARAIVQEWSVSDEVRTAPIWQDILSGETLQRYYAARLALARNETAPALREAQALLRADSSRIALINFYAGALMAHLRRKPARKHEWEDSLRTVVLLLKRAIAQDSLQPESARRLGEAYLYLQKWSEAERALVQAQRRDPTDSKIYVDLAHLHSSRLQPLGFRNELNLYQSALALNPLDVEAGLGAAEYLLLENRENEAIELLERFRRMSPNNVGVLMSLGRFYIVKGETVKIFEIYEHILALEPRNADAYYNLGIAYYNREDFENAIRFFERAIALNNHINARMYLSHIYERQGDLDKAIHYLRERIRLSPGDEDKFADEARKHLYEILLARGEIPPHLRPDSLKSP